MAASKKLVLLLGIAKAIFCLPATDNIQDGDIIPGRYIITLRPGISSAVVDSHLDWVASVHKRSLGRRGTVGVDKTYSIGTFRAYVGEFDDDTIRQIRANGNVAAVEHDTVAQITSLVTDTNAPWGLASLSSRKQLEPGNILGREYTYDDSSGTGTYAYVIDTGIFIEHAEFEGRAVRGYTSYPDLPFSDGFGHGTNVAGIIGSKSFGVVKNVTIVDVKVTQQDATSTAARIIEGYNWAVKNITSTPGRAAKSVINISLRVNRNVAFNSAVEAAYAMGVLTVVGAGNEYSSNISNISPASAPNAITVGAINWTYTRASWSNYGPGVDMFAPGVDIFTVKNVAGAVSPQDGTSMASPHVAGLVLYLKALMGLASPANATAKVKELAGTGLVLGLPAGTANLLAYNGNQLV